MALPSAFVAGPALPLRRTAGVSALSVTPPRRAAVVVAPRMMADKKEGGGLPFGLKLPSFGGKEGAAKAKAAAPKAKAAVNQFAAKASSKADATVAKAATATKNAAGKVEDAAEETFMRLQPGDAGYVEPTAKSTASSIKSAASDVGDAAKSAAKGAGKAVQAATPTNVKKAAGKAADAVEDAVDDVLNAAKKPSARGLGLLREDLLKSAPERAGIGRQDQVGVAAPTYGEPGYKYSAYEKAKQSTLGVSSFSDDANAAAKIGGIEALKKAAIEARKGASAAQLKAKALKIEKAVLSAAEAQEKTNPLPSYLQPLPEDTPRKYSTWKNY